MYSIKNLGRWVVTLCCLLGGLCMADDARSSGLFGAWGVDAALSRHVPRSGVEPFLGILKSSGVRLIRERGVSGPDTRPIFQLMDKAGLGVVAFAQDSVPSSETAWGTFPTDLRIVYSSGVEVGRLYADCVKVWELHNEPELAWWRDMPDRYVAHAKALYLGLTAGAREAGAKTPVIHGSLGLPPGPWLERSARNGLLEYGDAWNVHYYGASSQFTGFLDSHVQAIKDLTVDAVVRESLGDRLLAPSIRWPVRAGSVAGVKRHIWNCGGTLPVWATEVGVSTVTPDTWDDATRRRRQADWIVDTARQALRHPHLAVFMPFVLVHQGDGYALTEDPDRTWPAWEAYARFTSEHPFPVRPSIRSPSNVNPVVLQWVADASTASGHKLSAAYRWRANGAPVRGELRIYNFGSRTVSGRLLQTSEAGDGGGMGVGKRSSVIKAGMPDDLLVVPAHGMLSLSLRFALGDAAAQGQREWRQFTFNEVTGRRSLLGFALERSPDLYPPDQAPLELAEWAAATPSWHFFPHAVPADEEGPWRAANEVRILYAKGNLARFEVGARPFDPEYPPLAAARLPHGLPESGWLRLATRELGPAPVSVRVDLVDAEGRRFTQWEHLGHVRGLSKAAPRWLNLFDFHPYSWGKLDAQRRLKPEGVRELHLRFYAPTGPAMVDVELGVGSEYGATLDTAGEVSAGGGRGAQSAPVE